MRERKETQVTDRIEPQRTRRRWIPLLIGVLIVAIAVEAFFIGKWARVQWLIGESKRSVDRLNFERSLELLAEAVRWSPNDPELQLRIAEIYRHQGKQLEFELHWEQAKRLGADRFRLERERDLLIAQSGYIDRVDEQLRRVIDSGTATDEEANAIYEALARGYLNSYRIAEADQVLRFWLDWRPDSLSARFLRANVAYRIGRVKEAIDQYQYLLERVPDHFEARLWMGHLQRESNAPGEAIVHFQKAVELRPDSTRAKLELASVSLVLGNEAEAARLAAAIEGESLEPYEKSKALELQARIEMEKGDYANALPKLERALELLPNDSDLNYTFGVALRFLGDNDRAKTYLDRSQQIKDQEAIVRDQTANLIARPNDVQARLAIAKALFDQGLDEPAANWLRTIIEIDPDHLETHQRLAAHYQATGREDLAQSHRTRVEMLSAGIRSEDVKGVTQAPSSGG